MDTGSKDCPCLDDREQSNIALCTTPTGGIGYGDCFTLFCQPITYGIDHCDVFDLISNPECQTSPMPEFCNEKWCYVDVEKCRSSTELVYKSDTLPNEANRFYSYSTCKGDASKWEDTAVSMDVKNMTAFIVESVYPQHYKLNSSDLPVLPNGPETYNASIPWKGSVIQYVNEAIRLYEHFDELHFDVRSNRVDNDTNPYNAAVIDVELGICDMALALFWMTTARMRRVAFARPFFHDNLYLIIEEPKPNDSPIFQMRKVMKPFENNLWIALIVTIIVMTILSTWFAEPEEPARRKLSFFGRVSNIYKRSFGFFLDNFNYYCALGVDPDFEAPIELKMIRFGYAFFILIMASAYLANLAVFLKQPGTEDYIGTMDEAIRQGKKICVFDLLEEEIQTIYPEAILIPYKFAESSREAFTFYDEKKCDFITLSTLSKNDEVILESMCQRNLRFTVNIIMSVPIAFPVGNDYIQHVSHALDLIKSNGIDYEDFFKKTLPSSECSLEFDANNLDVGDTAPLKAMNLLLPFSVLISCALASALIQLYHGKRSSMMKTTNMERSLTSDNADASALLLSSAVSIMSLKPKKKLKYVLMPVMIESDTDKETVDRSVQDIVRKFKKI